MVSGSADSGMMPIQPGSSSTWATTWAGVCASPTPASATTTPLMATIVAGSANLITSPSLPPLAEQRLTLGQGGDVIGIDDRVGWRPVEGGPRREHDRVERCQTGDEVAGRFGTGECRVVEERPLVYQFGRAHSRDRVVEALRAASAEQVRARGIAGRHKEWSGVPTPTKLRAPPLHGGAEQEQADGGSD